VTGLGTLSLCSQKLIKFTKYARGRATYELEWDRTLTMKFNEIQRDVFWISMRKECPVVSAKGVKILLQFSTFYLCEQDFSSLTNIKRKKDGVLFLSRKNCECVCQKFGQKFNIRAERNKVRYHIKSNLYSNFGCELYFDV
jgi:hypothetical protein